MTERRDAEHYEQTYRKLVDLNPLEDNPRIHSKRQISQIVDSISEFGFTQPLLIDEENNLIAGHGRLEAAQQLVLDEVPCVVVSGLNEHQKKALVIADNKIAENAGWDFELLRLNLESIRNLDFKLNLTGFSPQELLRILTPDQRAEVVPNLPDVPQRVAEGELWLLGDHRLVCGDCEIPETVEQLLDGRHPELMVTDPPYGVNYDANWRNVAKRNDGSNLSIGAHATGKVENDDKSDWRKAWELFQGNLAYVWHAGNRSGVSQYALESTGLKVRSQIIWVKNNMVIGRGHYHPKHEPCWYAVRKGKKS